MTVPAELPPAARDAALLFIRRALADTRNRARVLNVLGPYLLSLGAEAGATASRRQLEVVREELADLRTRGRLTPEQAAWIEERCKRVWAGKLDTDAGLGIEPQRTIGGGPPPTAP